MYNLFLQLHPEIPLEKDETDPGSDEIWQPIKAKSSDVDDNSDCSADIAGAAPTMTMTKRRP